MCRSAPGMGGAPTTRDGLVRVGQILRGSGGRDYIFATELPAGPRAAFGMDRTAVLLRFAVALSVSGFICYLLTAYITGPILRLRQAAQQLAGGMLSTRAAASIERREHFRRKEMAL